jgi:hypothetical protein
VVVPSASTMSVADARGWSDRRYDDPPPREVRAIHGGMAISPDRRATRQHLVVSRLAAACVSIVVVGIVVTGSASAAPVVHLQAEDSTTTTETSGSTDDDNPLLVPGPAPEEVVTQSGGDDAEGEDVSTDAVAQDDPLNGSSNDDAEDTVRMVMFALIGVAVALGLLTVYYWWRTRPERGASEPRRRRGGAPVVEGDASADGPVENEPHVDGSAVRRSQRPGDGDAGTVGEWQTDSTSTR